MASRSLKNPFTTTLGVALVLPAMGLLSLPRAPGSPEAVRMSAHAAADVQQSPITLRLDPENGETHVYRYRQNIDIDLPPEFGGAQAVRSNLLLHQTARGSRGDTLRMIHEVREVDVDVSGRGDAMDFSRFEGQRFDATVTRRGEIVRLDPLGEAPTGVGQLRESMRQVGFPLLPPRPVAVGDSWVDTTRVEAGTMGVPADGDVVSVNRTTLERLGEEGDRTVAHLSVVSSFGFEPRRGGMVGMNVEIRGAARDSVRFDVSDGKFLEAGGRQNFVMNMSIPGSPGAITIRATGTRSAELVP